mgnify:FL=1
MELQENLSKTSRYIPPSRIQNTLNSTFHNQATSRRLKQDLIYAHKVVDRNCSAPLPKLSAKDLQKTELQGQLAKLRVNYDKHKRAWDQKAFKASKLKKELQYIDKVKTAREGSYSQREEKLKLVEERLKAAIKQQKLEKEHSEIYLHMEKRMQATWINYENKTNETQKKLESLEKELKVTQQKERTAKQTMNRVKKDYLDLKAKISQAKELQDKEVERLESHIKQRTFLSQKNTDIRKRHKELKEKVLIDENSNNTKALKEALLLHQTWHRFLNFKFSEDRKKSYSLEAAFERIKVHTGINDINAVVMKFLTKEQNYDELMEAVKQKENEVSEYKEKLEKIQTAVNELSISSQHANEKDSKDLKVALADKLKSLNTLKNKHLLISNTHQKIKKCLLRMLKSIKTFDSSEVNCSESTELKTILEEMKAGVHEKLTEISQAKDETREKIDLEKSVKIGDIIEAIPENLRSPAREEELSD